MENKVIKKGEGKVEGFNIYIIDSFKGTAMYPNLSPQIPAHIKELMNT